MVEVEVGAKGSVRIMASPCPGTPVEGEILTPEWSIAVKATAGSQLLGLLSGPPGRQTLRVPDVGWTRWALQLSPVYLQVVCQVAAGVDRPEPLLREGWRALLQKLDQRARDEASRLAFEHPAWALDLSDAELTAIVQQISVFPVPEAEALRWTNFLRQLPPGPTLLAFLRVAETSGKSFFRTFLATYRQMQEGDSAFIAFCSGLVLAERPEVCPPLPEKK